MRRPPAALLVMLLPLLFAACGTLSTAPVAPSGPGGLLATVEARGGECPEGLCSTRYELYRDGRVTRSDGAVDELDAATVARLAELVAAAEWDVILSRPFTGECPTAYDGQERVYTFQTSRGEVVVPSCTVQVDPGQEPFETLSRLLFGAAE